ncbi:MAG TPA: ribonuclease P protein component [Candidatus Acidoferrum sp.]|nr:ribonuclease P protein component [Candidatus Acidoferrum sp.]
MWAAARCWRRAARRDAIGSRRSERGELGFPREARLVRKGDFDAVYRAARRRSNSLFTLFYRPNQLPHCRYGFSIKKAMGSAVTRNRMRRRVREIIRLHRQELPRGWDIVIHPKHAADQAPFATLESELLRLLSPLRNPGETSQAP